jgi:O-antigen ligase
LQLIRKPPSTTWYHRSFRALGGFYVRANNLLFGQQITFSSLVLVTAAFFIPFILGVAAGLVGGLPVLLFLLMLLFLYLTLRDYRAGALIAVMLLPLSASHFLPRSLAGIKGLNPLNMVLVLSVISLLLIQAFSRNKILIPKLPRPFLWFLAVMTLAGLHGATSYHLIPPYFKALEMISFESPVGYLRDIWFKPMIILGVAYMLGVATANAKKSPTYLIPLFAAAIPMPVMVVGLVAFSGLSLSALAGTHARGFLTQLGIHANELGLMFNMCIALSIFVAFSLKHLFGRLILIALVGLLSVGLVLTFSRGAFLGYVAVIGYFLMVQRRFQLMLVVFLLSLVGSLFLPKAVVERATVGVKSGNVAAISAGRVDDIWLPLLPQVMKSPVIGGGLSSVLWSDPARTRAILPVTHPHNAYLSTLLDFGVVGMLIVFLFYRHMWQTFSTLARDHEDELWRGYFMGGKACLVLAGIQGITDDRFTPGLPMVFMWLSYGLALGLLARQQLALKADGSASTAEADIKKDRLSKAKA